MKNRVLRSALVCTAIGSIVLFMLIVSQITVQQTSAQTHTGRIQVMVVDGKTDTPIESATIVIPETGETYTTDAQGWTPSIEIPLMEDSRFSNIQQKEWGEVTLLVYKDNYLPYALFNAQVWEDQTRQGPTIYMFTETNGNDAALSIIEGPQREWVEELIEKYRPNQ